MPAAVRAVQAVQAAEAPAAPRSVVLGVDTHKDVHVAAVLDHLGALLGTGEFPATAVGYRQLLDWAGQCGTVLRAGVECTGSYGAGLARYLATQRVAVVEVNQPDRSTRRRRGKTDAIDAEAAARAALSGTAQALPKSGDGQVEALRILRLAKNSAVKARTQALNQLKAVLVNAPSALREELESLSSWLLVSRCAELVDPRGDDPAAATTVFTLRLLAQRVLRLRQEVTELGRRMTTAVKATAPSLLARFGIGPDSAAALLIAAGDNPERLGSEASFAALCGVSPVEQSSGKSRRRRLNRGGDRQANAALHRIVVTRMRQDERTRVYLERRTAEGKGKREVMRCLKRYAAREVYALIRADMVTCHQRPGDPATLTTAA
ncbi:IS110 family transposase [Streptomyces sp. NBC_00056]|uniref:IS110 family transposase n=1 Tax=unclassified Streptomyces TaxID=2593676 RepID=UPI00224DC560|nr:IS110 family transposase [Streptomyces sp. NBC_00063]MCX5440918.1 IS110 family transposase [Streptomyces sp. NBC_00063]